MTETVYLTAYLQKGREEAEIVRLFLRSNGDGDFEAIKEKLLSVLTEESMTAVVEQDDFLAEKLLC